MDKPFPYSEIVMDHFANPRNMGDMDDPSAVGNVGNPACGDMMRLYLKIKDGVIVDAKFKTFGCGAAIASSSMLTEMLKGKTLEEAMNISPQAKIHCSVMAEEALKEAMNNFEDKKK
jgi:nitrogen fixation NifU-like protein